MHRVVGAFGRRGIARHVDDELAFHLEMRTQQLIARGLPPEDARREAERQFGDVAGVRESCVTLDHGRLRAMNRAAMFDELRQDVWYAARTIRRNSLFATVIVLTLAIGIGANASIFSLVNALMLRELPVRDPDGLVTIGNPAAVGSVRHSDGVGADLFTYEFYTTLRTRNRALSGVLASGRADNLRARIDSGVAEPERLRGRFVSGNYFAVLGVPAQAGRTFDGSEDASIGTAPVVTISDAFWARRFARDPATIGREIVVNDARLTIIGVAPPGFTGEIVGSSPDLWLPLTMQPTLSPKRPWLTERDAFWLLLIGRRGEGVTALQAEQSLERDIRAIAEELYPDPSNGDSELEVFLSSGARGLSRVRESYGAGLLTLLAGVGLLLLIVCANVANLLLARAFARSREMSVRLAIGAGRRRLVRQLLTESLMLGALGAAVGLVVARWGSRLLLAMAADGSSAVPLDVGLDRTVLLFTLGVSLLATVIFGLVPALRTSRVDLSEALRAGTRTVTGAGGSSGRVPIARLLVSAQVGLSLVLLAGAALIGRSLRQVEGADTGLDRDHLVVVGVDARSRGYEGDRLLTFTREVTARLSRIPGVVGVTFSENGLFSGTESGTTIQVPGFVAAQSSDTVVAYDQVGPGYFQTIGARLISGRDMQQSDVDTRAPVVIVNESLAKFFFGPASPVGRSIRLNDSVTASIVGVTADVRDHELVGDNARRMYLPAISTYGDPTSLRFEVRSSGDPAPLVPLIRRAILEQDPLLAIDDANTLRDLMRRSIHQERLLTRLSTGFGILALILASLGLYGVMTYTLARRTGELGLRVALGAQQGALLRMIFADAGRMVLIGMAVGIPLTLAAGQLLRQQLGERYAMDALMILVAFGAIAASAFVSTLLPALRAARVAPLVALQRE